MHTDIKPRGRHKQQMHQGYLETSSILTVTKAQKLDMAQHHHNSSAWSRATWKRLQVITGISCLIVRHSPNAKTITPIRVALDLNSQLLQLSLASLLLEYMCSRLGDCDHETNPNLLRQQAPRWSQGNDGRITCTAHGRHVIWQATVT